MRRLQCKGGRLPPLDQSIWPMRMLHWTLTGQQQLGWEPTRVNVSSLWQPRQHSMVHRWIFSYFRFSFTGFALAALLSYKNLESSVNRSFEKLTGHEKDGVNPSFQISSRVVSVVVSNPSTQNLSRHVNITLRHLQVGDVDFIFSFWWFKKKRKADCFLLDCFLELFGS